MSIGCLFLKQGFQLRTLYMFHHTRYAVAIIFIAVLLVGIGTYYYIGRVAENSMRDESTRTYQTIEQRFRHTIWPEHQVSFETLQSMPQKEWKKYREFSALKKATIRFFGRSPLIGVIVYNSQGEPLFASEEKLASSHTSKLIQHISQSGGNVRIVYDSVLLHNDKYKHVQVMARNVRSYKNQNGETLFIIETLQDMTISWALWSWLRLFVTGVIAVMLLAMALIISITMRRAERMIEDEFQEKEKFIEAAKTAEKENRNKSRFLAHISHELRTPLNAIIGFSEILSAENTDAIPNENHRNYIKDIHTSGVHLLSLINDILDYSKAESGKLELEITEVNVTKLIINSMRLVSPRADTLNVSLVKDLPSEPIVIHVDAKKFRQIMLNLLSNSVKFTLQGGKVHVVAWYNNNRDRLNVEVRDTGIGIAPEDIGRALSPFEQVDNALSRQYEGTGLGLPLTKKLVELMGGSFTLKSEVDVGTNIIFSLPTDGGVDNEHTQDADG